MNIRSAEGRRQEKTRNVTKNGTCRGAAVGSEVRSRAECEAKAAVHQAAVAKSKTNAKKISPAPVVRGTD